MARIYSLVAKVTIKVLEAHKACLTCMAQWHLAVVKNHHLVKSGNLLDHAHLATFENQALWN